MKNARNIHPIRAVIATGAALTMSMAGLAASPVQAHAAPNAAQAPTLRTAVLSTGLTVRPATTAPKKKNAKAPSAAQVRAAKVVKFAMAQRGKPYRYGAVGPSGYDCSGLTMAAYRSSGKKIARTASNQLSGGTKIARNKLQPGDIVFFYPRGKGRVGHASIYIGNGKVVHAPRPGKRVEVISMRYMPYAGAVRY